MMRWAIHRRIYGLVRAVFEVEVWTWKRISAADNRLTNAWSIRIVRIWMGIILFLLVTLTLNGYFVEVETPVLT